MKHMNLVHRLMAVVPGPVGSGPISEHGKGHGHRGPGKPWNGGHAADFFFRITNHRDHVEHERFLAALDREIRTANAVSLARAAEKQAQLG